VRIDVDVLSAAPEADVDKVVEAACESCVG
jgi:hypothetical protein